MADVTKQAKLLLAAINQQKGKRYPLAEHPLETQDVYVKNLYVDMLCMVAQYEHAAPESALVLVERIMAGAGMEERIVEHVKQAMEMTVERFAEFVQQCTEQGLANSFMVDSMLVACCSAAPNQQQLTFLVAVAEALQIKKQWLLYLGKLASAILQQDTELYHTVYQEIPYDDKNELVPGLVCYLKEFVNGVLLDTDDLLWIYAKEKVEFNQIPTMLERKTIVLENIIVREKEIAFSNAMKVTVNNCEFHNTTLKFYASNMVCVQHCLFDFHSKEKQLGAIYISGTNTMRFEGCTVKNLYLHDSFIYGAITVDRADCIEIEKCSFFNIVREGRYYSILNCMNTVKSVIVCENTFQSCGGHKLFSCSTSEKDNIVIGCSKW